MNIFETIGMAWAIFTSALATIAVLWLAWTGAKSLGFAPGRKVQQVKALPQVVREVAS